MTLTITFSKEQIAVLEKASDLLSHALLDHKWADMITALAEKEIQRRTKTSNQVVAPVQAEVPMNVKEAVPAEALSQFDIKNSGEFKDVNQLKPIFPAARETIRPSLRKTVFAKDQCCQFKDPLTNKICGSVRFLEIDHIQPVWAGGDNSPDNLRILCSLHNKFKYAQESGIHPVLW